MDRIPCQMVVRHKPTGWIGVTIDISAAPTVCGEDDTPLVFQGHSQSDFFPTDSLEIIGPENAVADDEGCHQGYEGRRGCLFLCFKYPYYYCERHGPQREKILRSKDQAYGRFEPTAPYPLCKPGRLINEPLPE